VPTFITNSTKKCKVRQ